MMHKPRSQPGTAATSQRTTAPHDASTDGGSPLVHQHQRCEPAKPTSRYPDRLSLLSAWAAPLALGALTAPKSTALTCRPEEPSTASIPDSCTTATRCRYSMTSSARASNDGGTVRPS